MLIIAENWLNKKIWKQAQIHFQSCSPHKQMFDFKLSEDKQEELYNKFTHALGDMKPHDRSLKPMAPILFKKNVEKITKAREQIKN